MLCSLRDRQLDFYLRPDTGTATDVKSSTEKRHALPDASQAERTPFGKCFLDSKTDTVILNIQSQYSIG